MIDGKRNHKTIYRRAYDKRSRSDYWKWVVSKTEYEVDILYHSDSKSEICQKEIEFIQLYGRSDLKKGPLCNLNDGGEYGKNKSKLATQKQLETAKKNGTYEEMCERMRYWSKKKDRSGINSNVKRSVYLYDINGKFVKMFHTVKSCAEYVGNYAAQCSKRIDTRLPYANHYVYSVYLGQEIGENQMIRIDRSKIARMITKKRSVRLVNMSTLESYDFEAFSDASIFLGMCKKYISNLILSGKYNVRNYEIILL